MKSGCELCRKMARMRCEADQARLCWDCDAKVHSANFLVARHSRNLLCRVCQSPTPWYACGASLPYADAICRECAADGRYGEEDDVEEEEEVVEEIQVVPCSPPESCSISKEDVSCGDDDDVAISRKRARIVDNPPSRASDGGHECSCSSSHRTNHTVRRIREATVAAAADPHNRISSPPQKISKSGVSDSPRRLYREGTCSGTQVLEYRTSSNCPTTVDLKASDSC